MIGLLQGRFAPFFFFPRNQKRFSAARNFCHGDDEMVVAKNGARRYRFYVITTTTITTVLVFQYLFSFFKTIWDAESDGIVTSI
jgi:hypothetical protein